MLAETVAQTGKIGAKPARALSGQTRDGCGTAAAREWDGAGTASAAGVICVPVKYAAKTPIGNPSPAPQTGGANRAAWP